MWFSVGAVRNPILHATWAEEPQQALQPEEQQNRPGETCRAEHKWWDGLLFQRPTKGCQHEGRPLQIFSRGVPFPLTRGAGLFSSCFPWGAVPDWATFPATLPAALPMGNSHTMEYGHPLHSWAHLARGHLQNKEQAPPHQLP